MSWCPICRTEYREGFQTCADCGCELSLFEPQSTPTPTEFSFLTNIADPVICSLLVSKLESFGIPCDLLYRGTSQYVKLIMGASFEGADLYVPTEFLPEALEIIKPDPLPDDFSPPF